MKRILVIFIVLVMMIGCTEKIENTDYIEKEETNQLLIVTDYWPPFVFDTNRGVTTEIVLAAFNETDIDVVIELYPWERCLQMVQNNLAFGSFPWTETEIRKGTYKFSKPLIYQKTILVYLEDEIIDDFTVEEIFRSDYRIGVLESYQYLEVLETLNINLDYSTSELDALEKLINKRVDFVVMDKNNAFYLLEDNYPEYVSKMGVTPIEEFSYWLSLLMGKDYPNVDEILEKFNDGMDKIHENGVYDDILEKYEQEE
ncbi:MAG: transporter substrate-binding domain-containing protein [Clostridiales bacterium]|nr:transporter substrate-binding domain-containing protein [Clostridiales bacterium]